MSLEGVTAETHDAIVRFPGAFQKTVTAVKYLKAAGILPHTNTTITHANLHECERMPQFIKEEFGNDKFSMNLIIPTRSAGFPSFPIPGGKEGNLLMFYSDIGRHLERIMGAGAKQGVELIRRTPHSAPPGLKAFS